jgi:HPt (histidine-containing phosphotransfer) domain-containing protein
LPAAPDALPEHPAPPLALTQSVSENFAVALDREAFAELAREIGEEAAFEIHAVFIAETDARLKLFRELSIETERTKIGREAHSLKSAAGTFGYCELAILAQRLECDATRLTAPEYLALLDSMDATYARASAEELQR